MSGDSKQISQMIACLANPRLDRAIRARRRLEATGLCRGRGGSV